MNKTYWEITYYNGGMTPKLARFEDEAQARVKWAEWKDDPYMGAIDLVKVQVLEEV